MTKDEFKVKLLLVNMLIVSCGKNDRNRLTELGKELDALIEEFYQSSYADGCKTQS